MRTLKDFNGVAAVGRIDRPLRVCIATPDIFGPIKNGGIGTAYGHLATALVEAGHDVTILYTLGEYCEFGSLASWQNHYAKQGITFLPAVMNGPPPTDGFISNVMLRARNTYETLKKLPPFDIVHGPEQQGHLHYVVQAKRQGLTFQNTVICVTAHAPTLWALEGNVKPVSSKFELARIAAERTSIELADILVSPSRYMIEWLQSQGYSLPTETYVQQNIIPVDNGKGSVSSYARSIRELVFFGRIEKRKGLDVFINALPRLAAEGSIQGKTITFLGKMTDGADSQIALLRSKTDAQINVISDMDAKQALNYLSERTDRLAVIPSLSDNSPYTVLECLVQGIPFITSDVGGIPELIHATDRAAVTFRPYPKFLREKLVEVFEKGIAPARPAEDPTENKRIWLDFHRNLANEDNRSSFVTHHTDGSPLVSVCIIHFNRAEKVSAAVESIRRQSYENLEVILVDDGSDAPDAVAALDRLEREFKERGWKIVRQENLHAAAARNTGARFARGKYLLFLDDDNCAKGHEVETFVRCAETSGADILVCFADRFQSDAFPTEGNVTHRVTPLGSDASLGLFENCFGDTNAFVRREAFENINGFTEDYAVGREDHEFFARAVLSGLKLMVVPEALYWYRTDPGRLSLKNVVRPEGPLRVLRPYLAAAPPALHNIIRLAMAQSVDGQLDTQSLTWKLADGLRRSIIKIPGLEQVLLWLRERVENRAQ